MSRHAATAMFAFLVISACAAISPANASAVRIASPPEAAQIAQAFGSDSDVCSRYKISTIDENWAAALGCYGRAEDSWELLERVGESWTSVIYGGPDAACPLAQANVRIVADLGICPEVSTLPYYVFFPINQVTDLFLGIKPSGMATMTRAYGLYRHIRWSSWTDKQALGRGVFYYQFQGTKKRVPFRIRLYRAVTCENGIRIYTRRKLRAVRRGQTMWFRSDAKITRVGNCEDHQATEIF